MSKISSQVNQHLKRKLLKKAFNKIFAYLIGTIGLPILLGIGSLVIISIVVIVSVLGSISSSNEVTYNGEFTTQNLSEGTLKHEKLVKEITSKYGVKELTSLVLAIIEVESGGRLPDVMQSSESAGLPVNTLNSPRKSIEQGVKYLVTLQNSADKLGVNDTLALTQAYNFGAAYLNYLAKKGKDNSIEVADEYSKTVVAPSLGNTTGTRCSYSNPIAISYNGGYRYCNGGNFFYGEIIKQYLVLGEAGMVGNGKIKGGKAFKTIMNEALKYEGWDYVWGGANSKTGFDCSGLTSWTFAKAGIHLPRTAAEQYKVTKKVDLKDAKPGDLVFFKGTYGGPNHVSHVGIFQGKGTIMYDSNGSGIGYHDFQDSYWSKHFDSVRRVIN